MSIFDKWNKNIDKDFMENLDSQERGEGGNFEPIPVGSYESRVVKLELVSTKKGDPMFTAQFEVIGEKDKLKGQNFWMNQVILKPFQIHIVNEFLRSMESGIDEIEFKDYGQYNDLILNVAEKVIAEKLVYVIKIEENAKGFRSYTITDVFED